MELKRILVRATNWVGDAVMCLPALEALRQAHPDSHIAILAKPWVADLYRGSSVCDQVIEYDAPNGWRGLKQKWQTAKRLRAGQFDCAILLQNAFEAAALVWAARIPTRIGYNRDARGWLLTEAVPVPRKGEIPPHQRFYYLELLRRTGLIDGYHPNAPIRLSYTAAAAAKGRAHFARLGVHGSVVGVSPGAAFGTAKRWLPERFAEAADAIAGETNSTVAIFGSASERTVCTEVEHRLRTRCVNFAGRTSLAEFIALAAACDVFLSNDSGSMHVAAALGVPTVTVFGPTDETATGPVGARARTLREPVHCCPCHLRDCPTDHRCMTRVEARRVADAALDLISIAQKN